MADQSNPQEANDVARLLDAWSNGGAAARDRLVTVVHVSPATVKREWSTAKLWLYRELTRE